MLKPIELIIGREGPDVSTFQALTKLFVAHQ